VIILYFTIQKYNLQKNPVKETKILQLTRDVRKVRKRQHQYPEFGHTEGEILKKPAKKYISIQGAGG
jgi:GTP cyclohydrolase II